MGQWVTEQTCHDIQNILLVHSRSGRQSLHLTLHTSCLPLCEATFLSNPGIFSRTAVSLAHHCTWQHLSRYRRYFLCIGLMSIPDTGISQTLLTCNNLRITAPVQCSVSLVITVLRSYIHSVDHTYTAVQLVF